MKKSNWPRLDPSPYLEEWAEGDVRVKGTRIHLWLVIQEFRKGRSPEEMVIDYRSLSLEAVYGIINYYLRNHEAVDRHVALCDQRADEVERSISRRPESPVVARLRLLMALKKTA